MLNWIITGVIAFLAWRHYRTQSYGPGEKYMTIWPRFFAGFVDAAIFLPLEISIFFFDSIFGLPISPYMLDGAYTVIWFGYSIFMHARYGQTIGKRICKIKVIKNADQTPIGLRAALIRDSVPLTLYFGSLVFGLGQNASGWEITNNILFGWFLVEIMSALTNEKRRAIHDFIAGTVVVRVTSIHSTPISSTEPSIPAVE